MAPDMEGRATTAIGAMDALVLLIGAQEPGFSIASEDILPLLECVCDAVKKAVPEYRPQRRGVNDDDPE